MGKARRVSGQEKLMIKGASRYKKSTGKNRCMKNATSDRESLMAKMALITKLTPILSYERGTKQMTEFEKFLNIKKQDVKDALKKGKNCAFLSGQLMALDDAIEYLKVNKKAVKA